MRKRIADVLGNECGGPNVEQIIGIGIALAVGVALYAVASKMNGWLDNSGSKIENIQTGTPDYSFLTK